MSEQVYAEINDIRRSNGLRPLRWHDGLAKVARQHSENMAVNNFFSHTDRQGDTALERTQRARIPFKVVAENLAWSDGAPDPVAISVDGWMRSPGHRQNILRPEVTDTGVGTVRQGNAVYFTQLFIRRP
ncbi:MAG: CAP domain-containing protein [Acaryochloridaceae cyanobacterium SU_2_1]|nr:CAP domain-containing protein [Acaryochloridaceae cyanobacterium SU_2_1]